MNTNIIKSLSTCPKKDGREYIIINRPFVEAWQGSRKVDYPADRYSEWPSVMRWDAEVGRWFGEDGLVGLSGHDFVAWLDWKGEALPETVDTDTIAAAQDDADDADCEPTELETLKNEVAYLRGFIEAMADDLGFDYLSYTVAGVPPTMTPFLASLEGSL